MKRQAQFKIKGMTRDLAKSTFNPEFAYENRNVRILTKEDNSLLCITNEKGNKFTNVEGIDKIVGIPIGQAVIDNELILFTSGESKEGYELNIDAPELDVPDVEAGEHEFKVSSASTDNIYKLWFSGNKLKGRKLFGGNLNFSYDYPIETLPIYENEKIKKVYWTDGLNQPRVINIAKENISRWNNHSFDFVRKLKLDEVISVTKNSASNGIFAPGVIQYAFTYYDKYGQESNIFHTTDLMYTSPSDRGASPEESVSNSFLIDIKNVDTSFDYIRVYSILRTSIDATPQVRLVADLTPTKTDRTIKFNEWHQISPSPSGSYIMEASVPSDITIYVSSTDSMYPLGRYGGAESWENGLLVKTYTIPLDNNSYIIDRKSSAIKLKSATSGTITIKETKQNSGNISFVLSGNVELARGGYSFDYTSRIIYMDNGIGGEIIDPTELLYVGGEEIIAGTLSQKDNTLFLGNIKQTRKLVSKNIKDAFKGLKDNVIFRYKDALKVFDNYGYYAYKNQLDFSSNNIKTFKYLEWYRFGVQFQHYSGKWSEPIFIGDIQNTKFNIQHYDPENAYGSKYASLIQATLPINNKSLIDSIISEGFIRVRPVVVYPTLNDRECICQGVLCPTMYNVDDRYSNSPFVQSSWFSRPNSLETLSEAYNKRYDVNAGYIAEFRHNNSIPGNNNVNAEIQCITDTVPLKSVNEGNKADWVKANSENYFIDQSIVTLHSPDIEFDEALKSLDMSHYKLRIVGYVPMNANSSEIDIQTSSTVNNFKDSNDFPMGFYKEPIMNSTEGTRGLITAPFWFDEVFNRKNDNRYKDTTGFVVYPWHRNGSLNNFKANIKDKDGKEQKRTAELLRKKMSNLKFSVGSMYFNSDKIWKAEVNDGIHKGVSDIKLFNSNEVSLLKLNPPLNSNIKAINYYGNIDTVVQPYKGLRPGEGETPETMQFGYKIMTSGQLNVDAGGGHRLFSNDYKWLKKDLSDYNYGIDPVRIKYKSTPHLVIPFNNTSNREQVILPRGNANNNSSSNTGGFFWDTSIKGVHQDIIDVNQYNDGWLWLGEIYNDNVTNRFGGESEEALERNQWVPCGKSISLIERYSGDTPISKSSININWTEGDTYYQRYDHLKTYPFTLEDQNSIVEIVSFMCETRVNIDGRYDKNRGQINNLVMTPINFNKVNTVYSQQNNFFNYRVVNGNRINVDTFPNTITWTKTKSVGELIDTWTNVTLASTLDLDGDKGSIRALKRLNNNIIAFQDSGISQILYNENTQISTTAGVPIEIANSGKVSGKRYLTDRVGCSNKWSMCESPNGIYFIDDITKGIYLFNGQLNNLSEKFGFRSWINSKSKGVNIWDPIDFKGFVSYYDKKNGDILFISKDECLAFSEPLGNFTSFYSYENTPYIINLEDRTLAINRDKTLQDYKVWLQNEGDYNIFYDTYKPFSIEYIVNPEMDKDKIFTNIEFRSDTWNKQNILLNTTFDTLKSYNEYQNGETTLVDKKGFPSNIKRKFRIWRANIPRDRNHRSDRMRNTWTNIKLSMNNINTNKTKLYDMVVDYYI